MQSMQMQDPKNLKYAVNRLDVTYLIYILKVRLTEEAIDPLREKNCLHNDFGTKMDLKICALS